MAKKRIQRIPKAVTIKCPHCSKNMRLEVPQDRSIQFTDCNKCKQRINTPMTQCCIICAFTNKRCPYNLMVEAKAKGLELR